jgi:hypothetical protein
MIRMMNAEREFLVSSNIGDMMRVYLFIYLFYHVERKDGNGMLIARTEKVCMG